MKTTTMKKLALATLSVSLGLAVGLGCSKVPIHERRAPSYTESLEEYDGTPAPQQPETKPEPGKEFSGLRVVNGKPFADMYFKHYGVNPTIDTEEESVSTFSVDVDTASYTLAR